MGRILITVGYMHLPSVSTIIVGMECSVNDCAREARSKGMCNRHYENVRRYGYAKPRRDWTVNETLDEIGWDETPSGCWEWRGSRNEHGYGLLTLTRKGVTGARVHRLMHERYVGEIPEGLSVRHKCDNPPCVNPAHLEIGTHQQNMQDMSERGRHWTSGRTRCPNGHDLTVAGAVKDVRSKGKAYKSCVECARARSRKWSQSARAKERESRPPKPPRTHCKRGHDLSTTGVQRKSSKSSSSYTSCIECERDAAARFREKRKKERAAKPKLCRNGHDLSLPGATKRVKIRSGPGAGREFDRCVTCYEATQKRLKSRDS